MSRQRGLASLCRHKQPAEWRPLSSRWRERRRQLKASRRVEWFQSTGERTMAGVSGIKENMEVIGADGVHVGTVDRVEGDRIKLTKADSGEGSHRGHHHFIDGGLGRRDRRRQGAVVGQGRRRGVDGAGEVRQEKQELPGAAPTQVSAAPAPDSAPAIRRVRLGRARGLARYSCRDRHSLRGWRRRRRRGTRLPPRSAPP